MEFCLSLKVTKSTYAPLDDCVVNLQHLRSGKEISTLLEASYQGQNVTFELWHSSTKTKEGHLRLTTPFEALDKVDVEAWGHVRSGDIDVDAKMSHTWGDDVTVGISYKNENSDMGAGASLVLPPQR